MLRVFVNLVTMVRIAKITPMKRRPPPHRQRLQLLRRPHQPPHQPLQLLQQRRQRHQQSLRVFTIFRPARIIRVKTIKVTASHFIKNIGFSLITFLFKSYFILSPIACIAINFGPKTTIQCLCTGNFQLPLCT